jgi:hypothetical protein
MLKEIDVRLLELQKLLLDLIFEIKKMFTLVALNTSLSECINRGI